MTQIGFLLKSDVLGTHTVVHKEGDEVKLLGDIDGDGKIEHDEDLEAGPHYTKAAWDALTKGTSIPGTTVSPLSPDDAKQLKTGGIATSGDPKQQQAAHARALLSATLGAMGAANLEKAIGHAKTLAEGANTSDAHRAQAYDVWATLSISLGETGEGLRLVGMASKFATMPHEKALHLMTEAKAYRVQHDFGKALEKAQAAVKEWPELVMAQAELALAEKLNNNLTGAIARLERVLGEPTNGSVAMVLAQYYALDGKIEKGRELLSQVVPGPSPMEKAEHAMNAAVFYAATGEAEEMHAQMKVALDGPAASYARAYFETETGLDKYRTEPGFVEAMSAVPPQTP